MPARGFVVVEETNTKKTTTTRAELQPLLQGLRKFSLRYSRTVVATIFNNCRERAPDASVSELSAIILEYAESAQTGKSPIGILVAWSRKDFTHEYVDDYREEKRQRPAALTEETAESGAAEFNSTARIWSCE